MCKIHLDNLSDRVKSELPKNEKLLQSPERDHIQKRAVGRVGLSVVRDGGASRPPGLPDPGPPTATALELEDICRGGVDRKHGGCRLYVLEPVPLEHHGDICSRRHGTPGSTGFPARKRMPLG